MQNYFYDILPDDIQYYIYELRLTNILRRNYYRLISQKMTIAQIIINYELRSFSLYEYNYLYSNLLFNLNSNTYMDTKNKQTLFLLKKIVNIISVNDDKLWWLKQFITPIENSLILYKYIHNDSNVKKPLINFNIYRECYYCYFELLKKLNIADSYNLNFEII
tara:strand:+ start:10194 stop:10682 length:489 start_codon:yes stop_codon:yes gene_type:complete